MVDSKLEDEEGRVAALHRAEILDTPREQSFDRITGLVKVVLSVPIVSVSLIDANRQWFKSCIGIESSETARDISFCTHTIKQRVPLYIPDAQEDERFAENPFVTGKPHIRSYLGVPLPSPDGYNLGSLCAIDTKPREYSPDQIEVLKSFAALVTDEMELRRIAQTDHLTGAATRRGFSVEMDRAIAMFASRQKQGTLIALDIDHFKKVNDTYGHPMGDTVLRSVSATLRSLLRPSDLLGRLGGEEFGVLLPDVDLAEGLQVAERMRAAIEAMEIDHNPPFRVTSSFGVAEIGSACETSEQWMAQADRALYTAKRTGRNRVSSDAS